MIGAFTALASQFPPPESAREDGLLCLGGDLRPERLVAAYSRGIFPWYSKGMPILWWSPDPRCVMGETERRRAKQSAYNEEHGITPTSTRKSLESPLDSLYVEDGGGRGRGKGKGKQREPDAVPLTAEDVAVLVAKLEKEMRQAARDLEFEQAAELRDRIRILRARLIAMGKTISGLVEADPQFTLAGLVDSPERIAALAGAACPVSDSLAALLPKLPGAVVIDFTAPAVSLQSAKAVAQTGNALVIGTTGFTDEEKDELRVLAAKAPIFWASNMLTAKGIFFVTRLKSNAAYKLVDRRAVDRKTGVTSDHIIDVSSRGKTTRLRRIGYRDAKTGKRYEFLTNHFRLSAKTIADIYKERWQIEIFFREVKQNLHIKSFVGRSENAVHIQIYTALLTLPHCVYHL